jgi:spore coat protein U-like protein
MTAIRCLPFHRASRMRSTMENTTTGARMDCHGHAVSGLVALMLLTPFAVRAADCTVDTSGAAIAFGVYDPLASTPKTGIGTIAVNCSPPNGNNVPVTIGLGPGNSGSFAPRWMSAGAAKLYYNLYTTLSNSVVFGNGSAGTQPVIVTTASTGGANFRAVARVFGTMPAAQDAAFGNYSDTIQVTVTF